ncbi:hypothetical protein C5167_035597 [Papaver somniferum]|uniref:Non-specific lipid-transfer protein n=1 Tax=Papaver somniferum TaxID=3469 RepID=A0A4Y7KGD1_PAPSO|nr:hypothetical protein C5167_035597 [Papaver somniferum]
MMKVYVCVVVVLAMVQLMVEPSQAFTCSDVDKSLVQCMPYLVGSAPQPVTACCDGVKQIKGMATTTDEKRQACGCVKDAANKYQNIKEDAASGLPTKCGVPLSYPISKNIDCNTCFVMELRSA